MALPLPALDARSAADLLAEARARISRSCPAWTDLSPHDPGVVLLEAFAWLTASMIERMNRLPERAYVEFLRLIGVRLEPPAAARATLVFTLSRPATRALEIPRGTQVTAARNGAAAEPVIFSTAHAVRIEVGATQAEVLAYHGELVEAELVGRGTGEPGLSVTASRPPIVAPTGDPLDLVVGVEATPAEIDGRAPAIAHGGKVYRIWREVDRFIHFGADDRVFIADRRQGTILFAPAAQRRGADGALGEPLALAAVPPAGREIRLWYRRGGGPAGNVAAGALQTLKQPIPGLAVTNPAPATGGRAAEALENALVRGPLELRSLHRAVTASDFEMLALASSGAVAKAKALTQAELWAHATPGTVEVLLVPEVPRAGAGERITAARLAEHETEDARAQIRRTLEERRTLGTACVVQWARYKTVRITARVVVHRAEDPAAIKARILERLHSALSPLPSGPGAPGWPFGQALRASHVYDVLLSEGGVSYVDAIRLWVDEVPRMVRSLAADAFQPGTFYAGGGELLFRSQNDGDGWEPAGRFPGEDVSVVAPHPGRPGLLAVAAHLPGDLRRTRVHFSWDCGESWAPETQTIPRVEDLAWTLRDGVPVLLLATSDGLFQLAMRPGATPIQVLVAPDAPDLGFYAVDASADGRGVESVAVAATDRRGLFLSSRGGASGTFRPIGLVGQDVRVLRMQRDGPRTFLWAGTGAASGQDPGAGCFRRELLGEVDSLDGFEPFGRGWTGGSCFALGYAGSTIFAASHRSGVCWLDARQRDASWHRPELGIGLPLGERERPFQPVFALATSAAGLVLAGGDEGVFRSSLGERFEPCSSRELDKVTLPRTWLLCSGEHEIEVVEDDARRD